MDIKENNKSVNENTENLDHLTIVGKDEPETFDEKQYEKQEEQETQKPNETQEKNSIFEPIKRFYGLGKEEKDEDLEFVYSTYSIANEKPSLRVKVITFTIIGIFTAFLIWASFAQIDELARGEGKVIPTDKIQTVQSLDGGIVSEILVKEGQKIQKGDPLMKIDTTRFQATFEESKQEYLSLLALKSRLSIESRLEINKPLPKIEFDEKVLKDPSRYDITQKLLLENRFDELKSSIEVLKNQLSQKKQEKLEIESNIKKLEKSLEYIIEQRKTIRRLVRKGVKSSYDLLDIEKEYTQTKGELETAKLSITRSQYAISEVENKIKEKISNFKAEAANKLQETKSEINKFEAKMTGDRDKVARTILNSPVNGVVKQLNINTVGGVIKSGVDLIEIVPISDSLVVEAKISPRDIAFINPSHEVIIKITAYDFSIYGGLKGKITEISADTIIDENSKDKKSYYRVLVETKKSYLERDGRKLPIIPGMVASVDIVTGKKTILDFLLKPILKVKQDAFHERWLRTIF